MSFNDWREERLVDICDLISRGITPSYTDDKNEGVIVINQKCIRDNCINLDLARLTNPNKKKIADNKYLKLYDILVNSTGVGTLGRVAQVKKLDEKITVDSHVTIVRAKKEIHPVFLGYNLFMNERYIEYLGEGSTGQTELSRIRLGEALKVKLPPIEEQKAIANILSTLDDKIEVNNKINQKLEEMAQSIFKQWFIGFDFPNEEGKPYKSSGGELVESELGMIPKGWEVGVFRNYITDILGGDWGKEAPQGNYIKEVQCIRGADIPEINKGNEGKSPTRFILEKNFKNKQLTEGNLIVEISGGSPTQSTGRISYINDSVLNKFDKDIVCTNFCRAMTLKDRKLMEFVYIYWSYLYNLDVFFQFENGTTGIKNLDINNFLDRWDIVNPSEELINKYYEIARDLFIKIQDNGKENERLSRLRDTLLPKLMSGEIRVPTNN